MKYVDARSACLMSVILISALPLAGGCVASDSADVPSDEYAVPYETMDGPVSGNGMVPSDFWASSTQQALQTLSGAALLDSNGALVSTSLLDTAAGRSVLSYTCRCALGDGTTVQSAGGTYSFAGDHNIAPAWTTRGLTTAEQRWMTSCLVAHLNGLGAAVSLVLQGSNSALVPDSGDDTSGYVIPEMTAFGNIFSGPKKAYVCADLGLDLGCGLGVSTYTLQRVCGLLPTCGATWVGLCALNCSHDGAGNPTCSVLPLLGPTYSEAISTKVDETTFVSLYPLCDLL